MKNPSNGDLGEKNTRAPRFIEVLKMPRSFISRVAEARSLHRAIVNRLRFCPLSTVYVEDQMEKPQFDGKAIEGLCELVEHHAHQLT